MNMMQSPLAQTLGRIAGVAVAASLTACTSMHGVPVRYQDTSATVTAISLTPQDLANLVSSVDKGERNKIMHRAMSVVDLRFHELVRSLNGDRQDSAALTSYAGIGFNTAGTLISSVAAKTNYAAAAAVSSALLGVTEKQYYFEKTMPALVAAMSAARSTVEVKLRRGMQEEVEQYPGSLALAQLEEYFSAGTVLAAISQVTKAAETEKSTQEVEVERILATTDDQILERREISAAIGGIKIANLQAGNDVLKALGLPEKTTALEVRQALIEFFRKQARAGDVVNLKKQLVAKQFLLAK
jgi:hypothetical protein